MLRSRIAKITALAMSLSLVLALPAYATTQTNNKTNSQLQQNSIQMQQQQLLQNQGGIQQSGMTQNQSQNTTQSSNEQQANQSINQQAQVTSSQKLSSSAQYLVDQGIIQGDTSGNYNMENSVKRGDMSIMLMRAFQLESTDSTSDFGDVSDSSYYYDAVNTMRSLGIAQGDGQNYYPNQTMTIQEAILFVERALDTIGVSYDEDDLLALFEDSALSDAASREDVADLIYTAMGEDYVSEDYTTAARIQYETDENQELSFDEDDFNDVCEDLSDNGLDYVVFSNSSNTLGSLYYGYTSSSDYEAKVTSSDAYYYDEDDGDPLSDVTFVPADDKSGTAIIQYTGYDTDGDAYTGVIEITIQDTTPVADDIAYSTDENEEFTFDADDFNEVCEDATGETLDYVQFYLPSTAYGKLYYGYDASDDYDGKVTTSGKYYYDEEDGTSISDITFVPKEDYTGTVPIRYTGWNQDGDEFTGSINIIIH